MHEIDKLADLSVKRGCAFGLLAIWVLMTGLSGMPLLALKSGAICFTLMTFILAFRAHGSLTRSCRRTEVWVLLGTERRPPAAAAQQLIGTALNAAYWRYAELAAAAALLLWLFALALWLVSGHAAA